MGTQPSWGLYLTVSIPLPQHPSVPLPLPSAPPAPALSEVSSFPAPVTVQEIPGSAVPEAGRGPKGEALCQRTVQGQEGFIPPEVSASQTLCSFINSKEKIPQVEQSCGSQTLVRLRITWQTG